MATGKHKSSVPGGFKGRRVDGKRSAESMERRKAKKAAKKTAANSTKKATASKSAAVAQQAPATKPLNWPLIFGGAALLGAAALAASKAFGSDGTSSAQAPAPNSVPAAQPSAQALQDTLAAAVRYGSTALTRDQTMRVQRQLSQLGFDPGPADGVYGPRTAAAVQQYQRSRGLTPDGAAGPITRGQLDRDAPLSTSTTSLARPTTQVSTVTVPSTSTRPAISIDLNAAVAWASKNLTRDTVIKVQSELNRLAGMQLLQVDGIYGPKTASAVAAFQQANRLTVDGMAGRNTLAALFPTSVVTTQQQAQLAGMNGLGSCGCDVKRVTRTYVLQQ